MSVKSKLIEAIQGHKLASVVRELRAAPDELEPHDQQLLNKAFATCEEIRQACIREGEAMASLFRDAGIDCQFDAASLENTQFHQVRIDLECADPSRALALAEEHGYKRHEAPFGMAWEVFRRGRNRVLLMKVDRESRRLELRWKPRMTRVLRRILPTPADASLLPLPAALWPLTVPLRPLYFVLRKAGWQREAQTIGGYLGTPIQLIPELLAFADVNSDDVLIDLGCGDGRILIEAAKLISCRAIGYESEAHLCEIGNAQVAAQGLAKQVRIHHADAAEAPIEEASVVFLFLPPDKVSLILPGILARLPPHGRVIAHEILPIEGTPPTSKTYPLFSHSGMTVAHLWQATAPHSPPKNGPRETPL